MQQNYEILKNNTGVLIHAGIIEEGARRQIELISTHPSIKGLISIMPDVHEGMGCVIGFTGKFKDSVICNLVGVDIGCGVMTYRLKSRDNIDFKKLDEFIRDNIPIGLTSRSSSDASNVLNSTIFEAEMEDAFTIIEKAESFISDNKLKGNPRNQCGTMGSGNHFLEIEKGSGGELYLTVHSGSRNFGLQVANFYQKKAKAVTEEMNIQVPPHLEYLPMSFGGTEYLNMMKIAQKYAHYNRLIMARIVLKYLGEEFKQDRMIESVHNYIAKDNIIRKGAISAYKGEKVVIPLSMGEGIVIGTGKGNEKYNYSAPHGAGRMFGRKEMLRRLDSGNSGFSLGRYKEQMKGIFSTSIGRETFDESPDAYKPWDSISTYVSETVDIEEVAKPVYNLKSPGEG